MALILSGPTSLKEVANFIDKVSKGHYTSRGVDCSDISTVVKFWDQEDFNNNGSSYDDDNPEIPYDSLGADSQNEDDFKEGLLSQISNFAVSVRLYNKKYLQAVTAAFDKTLLENIISGQTFKPITKEFVILGRRHNEEFYIDDFTAYIEKMVNDANAILTERSRIYKFLGQFGSIDL